MRARSRGPAFTISLSATQPLRLARAAVYLPLGPRYRQATSERGKNLGVCTLGACWYAMGGDVPRMAGQGVPCAVPEACL